MLGMVQPGIVALSPNRVNIYYSVHKREATIEDTFSVLVDELREKRLQTPRTVIFCRSYEDVGYIYSFITRSLGAKCVEPIGAPNIAHFRLVDMFTAFTEQKVKDVIINFTQKEARLRVVIATVAFGMGLDSPNIRRIIHWGTPANIESYIQETGRAGRDGEQSQAKLYYAPVNLHPWYTEESMRLYSLNNDTCRRQVLLRDFDVDDEVLSPSCLCQCCDICAKSCGCDVCAIIMKK
jgi:ATP-dependent DNA helicase RecQ